MYIVYNSTYFTKIWSKILLINGYLNSLMTKYSPSIRDLQINRTSIFKSYMIYAIINEYGKFKVIFPGNVHSVVKAYPVSV